MTLQAFQDEQLNFFKFASIVLNEFPKALRQTFRSMWDNTFGHRPGFQPWDDSDAVRNMFLGSEGGRAKVPTNLSYEEWDCTALFQATIYAQSFALPDSAGHHKTLSDLYVKPHKLAHGAFHASVVSPCGNESETFALAIDQLRLLRNSFCHLTSSEIIKETFDQNVQLGKDAFIALGVTADRIDFIGGLTESDFSTNEVRKLMQAKEQETRAYIKFLEGMSSDIDELRALSTTIKGKVDGNASKEDIDALEQRINDLTQVLTQDKSGKDKMADSSHTLGDTQQAQGVFSSALQSKQRALAIRQKLFVEEHPRTADSYHTLDDTQHAQGDFSSALQSKQRALGIRLKLFGEEHSSIADSYHTLGETQHALGDFSSAFQCKQRALAIRQKLFGEEHPRTADSYHTLGDTQHAQGDFSSALQSKQRALGIRLKLFGEEHSSIADSYHTLGDTQHALNDFSSAFQSKQRALAIRQKLCGEEHSSTADSYHTLGDTQHAQGDFSSALQSKQRALGIRLKLFGEEHSSIADSYHTLGDTQCALGDLSSARQSKQRALDIRQKLFGKS